MWMKGGKIFHGVAEMCGSGCMCETLLVFLFWLGIGVLVVLWEISMMEYMMAIVIAWIIPLHQGVNEY